MPGAMERQQQLAAAVLPVEKVPVEVESPVVPVAEESGLPVEVESPVVAVGAEQSGENHRQGLLGRQLVEEKR